MAIADKFDHKCRFFRANDARTARRQFQVSIMLGIVLALPAVALEMLTQLAPPIAPGGLRRSTRAALKSRKRYWTFAADLTELSQTLPFGPRGA